MPYLVKKQMRKGGGLFWSPGDILEDAEVPKPHALLQLGWIEKTESRPAPEPTPEPAAPLAIEDKPKKKRGRPKKLEG